MSGRDDGVDPKREGGVSSSGHQRARVLVVLSIPPLLEDAVVDFLLEREGSAGFSSAAISGHSGDAGNLSTAEKVSGKQRRIQFQIEVAHDGYERFLDALATAFRGADVHYWIVPLLAAGSLARVRAPLLSGL
jgi:hypothetical protein